MVKIWEVDFTSFSGISAVAYDNIGSQDLVSPTSIVRTSGTLPEFGFRKGIFFSQDNTDSQFYLLQASGITNAYWRHPATLRSWNLWLYQVGSISSNAVWDSGNADDAYLWISNSTNATTFDNGFHAAGGSSSSYRCKFNNNVLDSNIISPKSNAWHMLTATVDRTVNAVKFYQDGVLVASGSGAGFLPATGVGNEQCIGYRATSKEGTFYLGLAQTFDHVLSDAEVLTMYNTFLVDSEVGETPYQTFSGTVFDTAGLPASGATVYLIHETTKKIESSYTTSGDGYYNIIVPYSGSYTVVSTLTPSGGARAFAMIAISGGVYFP
jgi:hypothetical protein